VQGNLAGEPIRESLDLFGWEKAQETIRDWEAEGRKQAASQKESRLTIEECRMKFLCDLQARKLSDATVYKYQFLFRQLADFALRHRLDFLDQLGVENLGIFRSEWIDGPCSSLKKLERLRAFFHFAQQRKWVIENPANGLKAPRVPLRHTMPFTRAEMIRILAALDVYAETAGTTYAQRLRAFVLLLRYSGMRIGDAVQCAESRIMEDRLFLHTQKTGPVYCVLPSFVIEALNATPRSRRDFTSGVGCQNSMVQSGNGKHV
jgi:integrase